MAGRIKIHGALNFVGSGAEVQNLELEELTQDPTGLNPEDLGRMWLNTAEKRIKCVIELDSENRPIIETLPRDTDIVALQTLLSAKADKGTTLSSYGIADAASKTELVETGRNQIDAPGTVGMVNNRQDTTVSFNDLTRTFTIAPAADAFRYYVGGVRYVRSEPASVVLDNVDGLWFVYFDDAGSLVCSMQPWDLFTTAPIAIVYWNAALGQAQFIGEERHGSIMDPATHHYMHHTEGTKYREGFSAINYTLVGDGSIPAHAQIGISDGIIQDEDIIIAIKHNAAPAALFEQTLRSVGYFPVMHRSALSWVRQLPTPYPVKTGAQRVLFNQKNGTTGQWETVEAGEGQFVTMFLMATNAHSNPIVAVMGQRADNTLDDAKNNSDFAALDWGTMPFTEFKALHRLIFQTSAAYANSAKAKLVHVDDLRNIVSVTVSAIPTTSHADLSGLNADDHNQYVHTSVSRQISALHTFAPTAARAPFQLNNFAKGQLVDGLNATMLSGKTVNEFQAYSSVLDKASQTTGTGFIKRKSDGSWVAENVLASEVPNLSWNKIVTDKPTTLSGYGITDAVPTNVLNILAGNVAVMSGSNTTIPYDNTTPLVTEGALVMQATVNPRGIDSRFAFNFNSMGDASTDGLGIILALFRKIGSGAWNCVDVTPFWIGDAVWLGTSSKPITLSMMHVDAPATIEPVSYMLRIGLTSSGSWYLGRGQDATFGGVGHSNYTITEFKQ